MTIERLTNILQMVCQAPEEPVFTDVRRTNFFRMGDRYMKQCDKGHFYDDSRFDSCPYCKDGTGLGKQVAVNFQNQQIQQFQSAPAQPAPQAPSAASAFKFCTRCGARAEAGAKFCTGCGNAFPVTAPVSAPSDDIGKTVAVQHAPVIPGADIGKTVALGHASAIPAPSDDIGKTVAVKPIDLEALTGSKSAVAPAAPAAPIAPIAPVTPVTEKPQVTVAPQKSAPAKTKPVAFMVCISGGNTGDYFAVAEGRNYIASGSDADIRLDKDSSVSAECHSVVTYNPESNSFTLSAGTGRGITYLNGNQIDVSSELKSEDRIKVGGSELLFIPVCTDGFKWETQA